MSKKLQLKKQHYYGGIGVLVVIGFAFYLGSLPTTVWGGGPGKAPAISNIAVSNITATSADMSWSTDIASSDFVCWTSYFSPKKKDQKTLSWECATGVSTDALTKTAHVANLSPNVQYTYFVTAMNSANEHKDTKSDFMTFSTLAQ